MALGIPKPGAPKLGGLLNKTNPGHFIALRRIDRLDVLCSGPFAQALEKGMMVPVQNASFGPVDGSTPLTRHFQTTAIDPDEVIVAMAAADGTPPVADSEREFWQSFRLSYDAVIDAPPYRVTGVLMLPASTHPSELAEGRGERFVAVFKPIVHTMQGMVRDVPSDVVLVNRSYVKRVSANLR